MAENQITKTIRDAEFDARSLSEFVYKPASFIVSRRLASPIHTLNYYIDEMNKVIKSTGYILKGDFASGATLDSAYDIIKDSGGNTYRWGGELPKTVGSGSTPESTGGFAQNAWVEVSDPSLKNTLFSGLKNGNGALKVDGAATFVASKFDLVEIDDSELEDGHTVITVNDESLWVLTKPRKEPDLNSQIFISSKTYQGSWVRVSGNVILDTIITVGEGGHYTSINDAINHLHNIKSTGQVRIKILLLSGYVLDEQIIASHGTDLGHIQIDAEDSVVNVNIPTPYIKLDSSIIEVGGAISQMSSYIFSACYNSKLPVINALFDASGMSKSVFLGGVYVAYNSEVTIMRGAGVNGASSGLTGIHGSRVNAAGANFNNSGSVGVQAFRNSTVDFRDGTADNAADRGAYCGSSSILEALQASFKNAGSYGIECYGGGRVHCRTTDVSGAKRYGFFCRDGSLISTRDAKFHNMGSVAIYATNNAIVACEGSSFDNVNGTVFYAENGAQISAYECTVGRVVTDSSVITAVRKSGVAATKLKVEDAFAGVFSDRASRVDVGFDASFTLRGGFGLKATNNSYINADNVKITGADAGAVIVEGASSVNINKPKLSCNSKPAISAIGASVVSAGGAVINNNSRGVFADGGSTVDLGSNAEINMSGGTGAYITGSSTLNAPSLTLSGHSGTALDVRQGSTINIDSATITGSTESLASALVLQGACTANAANVNITDCVRGVSASESSNVNIVNARITGATAEAVFLNRGSTATATDATLQSISLTASTVRVERGSTLDANGAELQTSGGTECNVSFNTVQRQGIVYANEGS